jgi:uncharacterized protein DUF4190
MAASPTTDSAERTTAPPIDRHAAPVADRRRHSGRATAALILGILGLPLVVLFWPVGLILAILAVVFGAIARTDARRTGPTNLGQAKAGLILGIVDIGLFVVVLVIGIIVATNG